MNEQLDEQNDDQMEEQVIEHVDNEQVEEKEAALADDLEQSSAQTDEAVSPKKKELSKARRIWRSFLLWVAVISLAFLAGMLTLNYLRLKPQTKELTSAYQTIKGLEGQVSDLSVQLNDEVERADSLQDARTLMEFLQVQVDVRNAQLALAKSDVTSASASLVDTTQKLEGLLSEIQAVDPGLAVSMPQRLSLIISGLKDNVDNAAIDLGLFDTDLQFLIDTLFGN